MSRYLITIAVGPVQDFIAAARRTRDLWFGSYVLSEISKAVAVSLNNDCIDCRPLIFPAPKDLDTLNSEEFNVGNKILAWVETDEPANIVKKAEEAAEACWKTLAEKVKSELPKDIVINGNIWNQQISDIVEIYAAWVNYEGEGNYEDKGNYEEKRKRLDQLLNARKNTRDFIQNPVAGCRIDKSSLDGLRENVLTNIDSTENKWGLRKAGLNSGEYLDCPGVVKRLGGKPDQFTPLSRLAIDPWLRGLEEGLPEGVKGAMNGMVEHGLASNVTGNQKDGKSIYQDFPYDGQLLYPFRVEAEIARLNGNDKGIKCKLETWSTTLNNIKNPNGEASPYMAILVADGDRMGELLDKKATPKGHRAVSRELTEFAMAVPGIVRKYRGHCVYAGGDDVLALLPLDQAIACSKALAQAFREKVAADGDASPTLSVGLGISHFMNPMTKQIKLAREAESLAKGNHLPKSEQRNALAIILQPRSGAPITFREQWSNNADTVLGNWINAHIDGTIPRQAGYNLRATAKALTWSNGQTNTNHNELIQNETARILKRKRKEGGESMDEDLINTICERAARVGLDKVADELIMTYRIAQAYKLAGACPAEKEKK